MWYSAQYEAHLKGTSVLRVPSLDAQAQNGMSQTPDEYVLNHQLVFSPHYRGFVHTPASGWYHYQSKLRIRKASNQSNLAQQVPVDTDTPVFVAGGGIVIQETPATTRYQEYNVHIFNGANGQVDWYEVDSLSMASAKTSSESEAAPTRWRFKAQATSGGFRITTLAKNVQASSTKRFAYHIHGLDRRPDSITANGKNIVYIYLPETQSVIFKLSAGEHHLLVDYP
jgi:alpha-glucosidase (family GH31 glycosyl hydrolase)